MRWLWLSFAVIVLDQLTKQAALAWLQPGLPVSVIPGFFNWNLMFNTGAAFSFLSAAGGWQRWFFIMLALVVSAIIVIWLRRLKPGEGWMALGLALVLGGALGNVIDRVLRGHVVDFIQWYFRSYYWPTFNLADSAITVGATILVLHAVFGTRRTAR
ncbi:MAG: signal peptidase II [Gammaproteobacteria bacterium]|jgi:signal peptidase II